MNCLLCNEISFENEWLLEIHRLKTHVEASSLCLICDTKYKSITHHLKKNHPEEYSKKDKILYVNSDELICKFCNFKSSMMQHLIQHIKVKHIEEYYNCEICNMKFKNLYDHNINCHGNNYYIEKCNVCNISFKTKKIYTHHLLTTTHKSKQIISELDDEEIEKKIRSLKISNGKKINNIQTSTSDIKCNLCDPPVLFLRIDGLKRHNNLLHNSQKEVIICELCNKTFGRKDTLSRHMKTVHYPKYIDCEICHKKILEREYYERHIKICMRNQAISKYPGFSKHEKSVSKYLIDNEIEFECQKKFPDLKDKNLLSFDFFIPNKNLLIEVQGLQHFIMTTYPGAEDKFKEVQDRDQIKQEYAKNNGYNYLILDTRDKDYINILIEYFKK